MYHARKLGERLTRADLRGALRGSLVRRPLFFVRNRPVTHGTVPPLVEPLVAAFSFLMQLFSSFLRFVAVPAVVADGVVIPAFCFFDSPLAPGAVVVGTQARQPNKHHQEGDHCEREGRALHPGVIACAVRVLVSSSGDWPTDMSFLFETV